MAALHNAARRGMTLIELLVVISILLILVTAATTMMNVATDGAEVREAARQVNTMIAGCIARAAETGRPAGIWIDRATDLPNVGREIFFAASPPLYAGSDLSSVATFGSAGATTVNLTGVAQMSTAGFVQAGDLIRFNYSGPWYEITGTPTTTVTFSVASKPAPVYTGAVPFQIRRGPRKSLVAPLQMPAGTAIDFSQSGMTAGVSDSNPPEFSTGTDPVRIMFNPNGSVDRLYFNGGSTPVVNPIHLLVGRQTPREGYASNLADMSNRWISINPQTGTVITSENMGGTLANARQFAVTGKGMGGN